MQTTQNAKHLFGRNVDRVEYWQAVTCLGWNAAEFRVTNPVTNKQQSKNQMCHTKLLIR